MDYRKDIDGLRAVAVLPALFFHAGFAGFDGGYVGIEIFFVVSGYLITNIILNEQGRGDFSLFNFYERRARRILPALTLVLLVTTVVAYLIMPAYLLRWYSQSLLAVSTFASNYYFFLTTGYFSPAAGEKPLLHMWSLAVEEQYYFVYPLFMMFMMYRLKAWLPVTVLILTFVSLVFAHTLALMGEHIANYYHTMSRAWELLAGAVIALWTLDKKTYPKHVREILSLSGFAMIVFAVACFDQYTLYPSLYTLIPVLGTCLIIVFGGPDILISRILSVKAVVLIGLMSYSVYLWHHPVYAFLRLKSVGDPGFEKFVVAVIVTLILGYLSWKFVEQPFRDKRRFSRKQIFIYSFISVFGFSALGLIGHYGKGFPQRYVNSSFDEQVEWSEKRVPCHTRGKNYLPPEQACEYFGDEVKWAVMGDSHSVELAYELARRLEAHDIGLKHLSHSDCPPSMYLKSVNRGCYEWFHEAMEYLTSNKQITNVFLTYRHVKFLYGEHVNTYPDLPDVDPNTWLSEESKQASADEVRKLYWQGFLDMIQLLQESGKNVYVLYPVPEIPVEYRRAVRPFSIFSHGSMVDLVNTVPMNYYYKRQAEVLEQLNQLDWNEQLIAVNPVPAFCDGIYCSSIHNQTALYIDDDHPSLYGAGRIIELMLLDVE